VAILAYTNNDYSRGELRVNDTLKADQDLWFKTGYITSAQPKNEYRYWGRGTVSDIVPIGDGVVPDTIHVGDNFYAEFALPLAGALAEAAPEMNAYFSDALLKAHIVVGKSVVAAQGTIAGVANDLPSGLNTQDILVAQYSTIDYSDIPLGQKSTQLQLVMSDTGATALTSVNLPTTINPNNFNKTTLFYEAVDTATVNADGSSTLDSGYLVMFNVEEIKPAETAYYDANFGAKSHGATFTLSSREQGSGSQYWFSNGAFIGDTDPLIYSPTSGDQSHTIKYLKFTHDHILSSVKYLVTAPEGYSYYAPQTVVQLIDTNADGSFDEYVYNPATVKIGISDTAIYAVQVVVPTPQWFERKITFNLAQLNTVTNPIKLLISDSYYADYTNLEDPVDPYGRAVIAEQIIDAQSPTALTIEMSDHSNFNPITSAHTRLFINSAGTQNAVVELAISRDKPLIIEAPLFVSSSSQSSTAATSSSSVSVVSSSQSSVSSSSASSISIMSSSQSSISVASSSQSSAPFISSSSSAQSSSVQSSSVQSSSVQSSSVQSSSVQSSSVQSSSVQSSSSVAALAPARCQFVLSSSWPQGFVGTVKITNLSQQAINGWNVHVQASAPMAIQNLWNAINTPINNQQFKAENLSWNRTIPAGQSVEFGFQAALNSVQPSINVTGDICR
jgi:hypothetical protein